MYIFKAPVPMAYGQFNWFITTTPPAGETPLVYGCYYTSGDSSFWPTGKWDSHAGARPLPVVELQAS